MQGSHNLKDQVIVITGASSGIGLATAVMAADLGAKVVLSSRNGDELNAIVGKITAHGGTAVAIVADVTKRSDLEALARGAKQHFGRIDTWVNNAGVSLWGRMVDVSEDDHRRLFDINFWGIVNGAQVAVRELRRHGTLINLGSVASDRALPLQGMYSASKHAVKGFTDALRMELYADNIPLHVTLIKPGPIATPLPAHAKNYTGRAIKLPSPLYKPEDVARSILYAACNPVRDLYVGGAARVISFGQVAPRLVDWLTAKAMYVTQTKPEPAPADGNNFYEAGIDGRIMGDHSGQAALPSLYTAARVNPNITSLIAVGLGAAFFYLMRNRR